MSDLSKIYSAVYSGVPVFEMIVNDVAVMRRRTDSYMNATQILKVANIEKGKRTKILEKEVLIGEHEKVQGGYGKYQGTWIPFDKSKELAERHGVLNELAPIFNFELDNLGVEDNGDSSLLTKEQAFAAKRKLAMENSQQQQYSPSSQPKTPQKIPQKPQQQNQRMQVPTPIIFDESAIPRKKAKTAMNYEENMEDAAANERDQSILMAIYLADKPEAVMDLLSQGSAGHDIDMVIDEQGHTSLHWAASLARIMTVERLVSRGANIACTSYTGETPLMRTVMVANSFEANYFPHTLELLKETLTLLDNKKRNVLHHAALSAGIPGRMNAAVYYIKNLVDLISGENEEVKSIIDAQDSLGDTALTIAARLECQSIIDLLLEAGATQSAENNNGLQMMDYSQKDTYMASTSRPRPIPSSSAYANRPYAPSQRGKEIVATVQKIVDALDDEYGGQLTAKEQELQTVQDELNAVTQELETTRKGLEERQAQSQQLAEAQQKTRNIKSALEAGWSRLEEILKKTGKPIPNPNDYETLDENEDIDAQFAVPELTLPENATEEEKKKLLEEYVKNLQAKVKAYTTNDQELQKEIKELEDQFIEKELQCKRLIAACCNLPIDKIDDLVEPLTLAIESDPPDLDLARVIGFMDKIRRQGAFAESSVPTVPVTTSAASTSVSHSNETATAPAAGATTPQTAKADTADSHHTQEASGAADNTQPAATTTTSDTNTSTVAAASAAVNNDNDTTTTNDMDVDADTEQVSFKVESMEADEKVSQQQDPPAAESSTDNDVNMTEA